MRLVACALSTVLLSGCSWFGMGGGHGDSYGYNNYGYGGGAVYGGGCAQAQPQAYYGGGVQYAQQQYTLPSSGCTPGQGYNVSHNGYQQGMGGQYGAGQYASGQYGMGGQYGGIQYAMGQGAAMSSTVSGQPYSGGSAYTGGAYGQTATTLTAQAPYGAAVGGGSVQTIQGAPIYVGQPYAAYGGGYQAASYNGGGAYGYGGGRLRGPQGGNVCCGGGGLPFGIEAGVGTEFGVGGDIFGGEVSKPFIGGPGVVSDLAPLSFKDAYKNGVHYNLAATYDLSPNTTVMGQIGYSKAEGKLNKIGTVSDGGGTTEDLYAQFSDLEQVRLEGGLRQYMGDGGYTGLRPYVGASAGFVNTQDVVLTQSSATLVDPNLFQQTYIQGGWTPTASGIIGAEWQVGARSALGVETGIRWSDDYETNLKSTDQWSIPLKVRGRVSF